MRFARSLPVVFLSLVVVTGCATASAGWTYAPAPTPAPAPSGSGVASAAPGSAAPSGAAPSGSAAPSGPANPPVITITAQNILYTQTALTAPADTPFQIKFENMDAGVPHDVTLHLGGPTGSMLFQGTVFNGIETRTYDVPALDQGTYSYVCIVHPTTMIGTLTVQ